MVDFDVRRWGTKITEGDYSLEVPTTKNQNLKPLEARFGGLFKHLNILDKINFESPFGLPSILEEKAITDKLESHAAFKAMCESLPLDAGPPKNLTIAIKTDKQTFNHVNDYVIHDDGIIWYRKRNQTDESWRPMYLGGFPDTKPLMVQADGANFIAVIKNDKGEQEIVYKKILKETLRIFEVEAQEHGPPPRKAEILAQTETHVFTIKDGIIWARQADRKNWLPLFFEEGWPDRTPVGLAVEGTTLTIYDDLDNPHSQDVSQQHLQQLFERQVYHNHYDYSAITKDKKDNYKTQWFTLPFVSEIKKFVKDPALKLPANKKVVGLAISNRGGFAACWEDFAGHEHPCCPGSELSKEDKKNFSGVTTLYLVLEGENFIRFADPWLPFGFSEKSFPGIPDKKIPMPDGFEFEALTACGSMLFISGMMNGEPCILYGLADFDTTGFNIFLPRKDLESLEHHEHHGIGRIKDFLFKPKEAKPADRVLPKDFEKHLAEKLWKSILLGFDRPVDYKKITGLQTGPGNNAKELRIACADEYDPGYYWKSLQDDALWQWNPAVVVR